tara:strand:+ start:246 stop:722 length:477 start_codon:yes stop_codon:yes gene_type:complete
MATIKAYSVSRTSGAGIDNPSGVYSLGSGQVAGGANAVPSTGRNGAYDHNDQPGREEGRVPTLVLCGQTPSDPADATPFSGIATAGANPTNVVASTAVVCTTTTITGDGAGLVVSFTTTAAGAIPAEDQITAVFTGEGYSTGDTVQIDGWVGSVATLA